MTTTGNTTTEQATVLERVPSGSGGRDGIAGGGPAVFVAFEEKVDDLMRNLASLGFGLPTPVRRFFEPVLRLIGDLASGVRVLSVLDPERVAP